MSPNVQVHVRDLARSGVPISLFRMLRWATTSELGRFSVVAERGGPLVEDLRRLGVAVEVLEAGPSRSATDALAVGLTELGAPAAGRLARRTGWRRRLRRLPRPDVVVAHGLGGLRSLGATSGQEIPVVVHVHELEAAWRRSVGDDLAAVRSADAVMAVCQPVADLCRQHGVDDRRIVLVPGSVDLDDGTLAHAPEQSGLAARRDLVVGVGSVDHRKGTDRFVALAHELRRCAPAVQCRWIGGEPVGANRPWVESSDPVDWVAPMERPWDHVPIERAVLVVPSREDPLPLVVLEAACRGIPVVATRTGGLIELLGAGRGTLVDHDVESLASAVLAVLGAPVAGRAAAERLRAEVGARFLTPIVGRRWWEVIEHAARSR